MNHSSAKPQRQTNIRFVKKGFTLIELLVSVAVSSLLILMLATLLSSATNVASLISGRLVTQQDAQIALDFLGKDIAGISQTERSRTTLTIVPETLAGQDGGSSEIPSYWLMMISRPASYQQQGAVKGISYRMVLTDPMTAGGSGKRLSLYRTELVPPIAPAATFLDVADLHANFWSSYWTTYSADNGGQTLLNDYLVENIVGIEIDVTLKYEDSSNVMQTETYTLDNTTTMNWTPDGFVGNSLSGILPSPNTPVSISLRFTSLRPEGAELYKIGGLTLAEAIEKHGKTHTQTFPLLSNL